MKSFKSYNTISEMAFRNELLSKLLVGIQGILQKKLGQHLFQYGGPSGTQEFDKSRIGHGTGALFFVGSETPQKAFRLNYESRFAGGEMRFTSLDVWKEWGVDSPADVTVQFDHSINLISIVGVVADIIKDVKPNKEYHIYDQYGDLKESEVISEAKRVTVDEFMKESSRMFPGVHILSFAQLKQLSNDRSITIPGIVWKSDVRVGSSKMYDIRKIGAVNTPLMTHSGSNENITLSAEDIEAEKKIDPKQMFQDLSDLADLVIKGTRPSLLVTGDPGTGKTFTVKSRIKTAGLEERKDWVMCKGKVSPFGLYSTLFLNKDKLIVFDDSDDVFNTPDARNILKAALDSYDERIVTWNSRMTINTTRMSEDELEQMYLDIEDKLLDDPSANDVKLPSEFEFTGQIIFISNLSKDKIEPAIISRSLTIDISLNPENMFARIESLLPTIESDTSMAMKKEVLEFLREVYKSGKMSTPNMRTFVAAINIRKSGLPSWKNLLKYV